MTSSGSGKVVIKGLPEIQKAFRGLDKDAKRDFKSVVKKHTKKVAANARKRVPVDEGELRSTIRETELAGGLIGRIDVGYGDLRRSSRSNRPKEKKLGHVDNSKQKGVYAMVVEFGDPKRNHPAQPYLFPSIEEDKPEFEKDAREAIGRTIQRNTKG